MTAAFLATFLFAFSVVFANRTTRMLGAMRANVYRLVVATVLLASWGHVAGQGLGGGGFCWFFLSGCIGFGVGDLALYRALPRLGSRLSGLMIQCLAAPFALVAEWSWMGIVPSTPQLTAGLVILVGVAVAVAPREYLHVDRRVLSVGLVCGVIAALGQGLGAVVSRRAYAAVEVFGGTVDGMTAAYQRILGGLAFGVPASLWLLLRERSSELEGRGVPGGGWNPEPVLSKDTGAKGNPRRCRTAVPGIPHSGAALWVLGNALAGPVVGVACYQWALSTTPSAVVLPVVATMPIAVIPLAYVFEGDRPTLRSIVGGMVAVAGAVGLTLLQER